MFFFHQLLLYIIWTLERFMSYDLTGVQLVGPDKIEITDLPRTKIYLDKYSITWSAYLLYFMLPIPIFILQYFSTTRCVDCEA
jgi:hypothetical protein